MHTRLVTLVTALALLIAVGFSAVSFAPRHDAAAQDAAVSSRQIVPSAARTATGTGATFCGFGTFSKFAVQLVVSAASGTTPTLDVTWQHSIDGGTTWYTVVAFTQATAATSALKVESDVEAATAEVWGDCFRSIWTIGGTTPSFTFLVDVQAQT